MATTYKWRFTTDVIPEKVIGGQTYTDLVSTIHWRLIGTDDADGTQASVYGATQLNTDDVKASTFIEFANVTAGNLATWAKSVLEAQEPGEVDRRKQQVADAIARKQNPPVVPKTPPETEIQDSEIS